MESKIEIKINHHRENEISNHIQFLEEQQELLFEFDSEILPYQGFEVMWHIDNL